MSAASPDSITKSWTKTDADRKAVSEGCWFDLAAAERVRHFFSRFLKHSKGQKFAGQKFDLLPWQWEHVVGPLFGWRRADGTRRYRRASVWVPKKNGKSTIAAGLILYMLIADNEPGSEVYGAARDRNQAGIIFNEVRNMVRQSSGLSGKLQIHDTVKQVKFDSRNSFYQVLSSEAGKTGHGLNAHGVVIDELHVCDRELYSTLRYAGASRSQPLFIDISTAGNDKLGIGFEQYQYAKRVKDGVTEDADLLVYIAEADSNEQWEDEKQWHKANPSLGVTIPLDSFRADFVTAKNGTPSAQADFKQLRLNLWQETHFAWLPLEEWDACKADFTEEELIGFPCWGGLDLSSKLDITAEVLLFQRDDEFYLVARFWCPEEADSNRQKANKTRLKPWILGGHIQETPGNVVDYDLIEKQVASDAEKFGVKESAYDPWNAQQLANHLQEQGVRVVEFPQTLRNFCEPMKELERLVKSRKIRHNGNPAMRWMVGNVCVRKDSNGNIRPDKQKSADKIDGVVALLMALARATLKTTGTTGRFYEENELEMA